jgi:hypothetical protein
VPVDAASPTGGDTPAPSAPAGSPGPATTPDSTANARGDGEDGAAPTTGVWATRSSRLGLLAVSVVPILANLPAIIGLVKYQPILNTSGLGSIARKGYIPGQPFIDPNVGYNSQAIGHAAAISWFHFHVPWWNLNDGLGMPLAASVQSASFLPLTLLQAVAGGSLLFHIALELIAGVATYALLRQLRCSPFAAAIGGIAFSLNGSIAWVTNAPANPVPFLPLCLLGIEYVVGAAGAKRRGGWVLLAVGVWLSVVAGFPEVAVINAGLVAAWFVVRLVQRWPDRVGILVRGALGVVVGFALAAPLLNAFVRYLKVANVGIHTYPLATFTIPRAGLAQLVSPYLFGGILDTTDKTIYEVWTRTGGYAGATLLVLAIGAMWGRRELAIRVLLGAWAVLFLGSNYNVPVLHQIVQNIPGLTHLAVFRYDTSSALLCLCLLAAFCIDDLARLPAIRVLYRLVPGIAFVLVLFTIGFLSAPSGRAWAHLHVPRWYWGSIALFVLVVGALVVAIVVALVDRRSAVRVVVGAVLVIESFGYFVVPILAWPRSATVDTAPITYLRAHLGVQRYYSTGPGAPNYGAYYDVPSLGASDLPIPRNWGTFVHYQLSPCILPWQFGNGGPVQGCPITPVLAAMRYVKAYEQAGVKYLLVGHRTHLAIFMQPQFSGATTPNGGATIVIKFGPPAYFETGVLTSLAIDIPGGPPPGLATNVCSGSVCVTATPAGVGPGGEQFSLAAPLTLDSALSITLTASAATPVHVVTAGAAPGIPSAVVADGVLLGGATQPRQARVTFTYAHGTIPRLVQQSPTAHIYLLPHPSPIATAPGCAVVAHSFTSFSTNCKHASKLTYRELSFKGWSATVNGQPTTTTTSNGVFQQLALPAGTAQVSFTYTPPQALLAWVACLLALLAIAASLVFRRVRVPLRRRPRIGRAGRGTGPPDDYAADVDASSAPDAAAAGSSPVGDAARPVPGRSPVEPATVPPTTLPPAQVPSAQVPSAQVPAEGVAPDAAPPR